MVKCSKNERDKTSIFIVYVGLKKTAENVDKKHEVKKSNNFKTLQDMQQSFYTRLLEA